MTFKVHIITPEKALPELDADHVTIVAVDGQVGIRTDHAPLVALIAEKDGYAMIKTFGKEGYRAFALKGGVAQMLNNQLKILSPRAVDVHQLDTAATSKKAEAAKDDGERAWLQHQLAVAAIWPAPTAHV